MAKKNRNEDYTASLQERFDRWDSVYQNGCRDPFWSDGVNLNLIRNHIIFYKSELEKSITDGEYPEIYYRDTPPKVDSNYIARPNEIRENARKTLLEFEANTDLKFIKRKMLSVDDKFLKKIYASAVIGYEENLKCAIENDDLIGMRRYEHYEHYMDAFQKCAEKLREYSAPENSQISVFDMPEADEMLNISM